MLLRFLRHRGLVSVLIFEAILFVVFTTWADLALTLPRFPLGSGVVSVSLASLLGLPAVLAVANAFNWALTPLEALSFRSISLRIVLAAALCHGFALLSLLVFFGEASGLALLGGYCYFLSLFSIGTHLGINKLFWVLPTLGGLLIVNAPSAWLSSDLYEATFGFFYSENKIEFPFTVFMLTIFIVGSLFLKKPKVIS
jgi:hypothetical protein